MAETVVETSAKIRKIDQLEKLVQENGTEKMKMLIALAKEYINGLDKVFFDRDVFEVAIDIDLGMFVRELEERGVFKGMGGLNWKILMMNVQYIARHAWEFTDKYGKLKTGDDLHKAAPLFFEGEKMLDVQALYEDMKFM